MKTTLTASGWTVRPSGTGFVAASPRDGGTSRTIHLEPSSPGREGLLGVMWKLNRYASHTEQLGDAMLNVGIDGRPYATLWFVPPDWDAETLALHEAVSPSKRRGPGSIRSGPARRRPPVTTASRC